MTEDAKETDRRGQGLSSAKREDIWALIIAGLVMAASLAAPEGVHRLFEEILYIF